MRSDPEDLMENLMMPAQERLMSKRDLARRAFVRQHDRNRKMHSRPKHYIALNREKLLDIEDGSMHHKGKSYKELVESINEDMKSLERIDKPMMIYKEEKQMTEEDKKVADEFLQKTKRVWYPLWTAIIILNSLALIAIYNQNKLIAKDASKIRFRERFRSYRYL